MTSTETTGSIGGFFSGGGKTAKFPAIGSTVTGTITAVHPPEPQTDFESRQPIPGKYQIRIELQTDERDPDVEGDDGKRTVYVKGWLTGAVGDALRKAGAAEPQVGGKLSVTYTSDGAPTRPGLRGPKQYSATYEKPSFFNGQQPDAQASNGSQAPAPAANETQNAPIPDEPPAGIDPKAWATMPQDAKQAIANTQAPY